MSMLAAAIPLIVTFAVVAYEVRSSQSQGRNDRRAEQISSAFFDMYGGWALNRRAQIAPIDTELLRTSAAQYYTAAFRLSVLIDDEPLRQLKAFMNGGLGDSSGGDRSFDALWELHCAVASSLGYRVDPPNREEFREMFWGGGRNVPGLFIGTSEVTDLDTEQRRAAGSLT